MHEQTTNTGQAATGPVEPLSNDRIWGCKRTLRALCCLAQIGSFADSLVSTVLRSKADIPIKAKSGLLIYDRHRAERRLAGRPFDLRDPLRMAHILSSLDIFLPISAYWVEVFDFHDASD